MNISLPSAPLGDELVNCEHTDARKTIGSSVHFLFAFGLIAEREKSIEFT